MSPGCERKTEPPLSIRLRKQRLRFCSRSSYGQRLSARTEKAQRSGARLIGAAMSGHSSHSNSTQERRILSIPGVDSDFASSPDRLASALSRWQSLQHLLRPPKPWPLAPPLITRHGRFFIEHLLRPLPRLGVAPL